MKKGFMMTARNRTHETRRLVVSFGMMSLLLAFATASRGAERFDWMPPEMDSEGLQSHQAGNVPPPEVTITPTPKATADRSRFTREYVIDLKQFGIRNDGTHAQETSAGLNDALQHAKTIDANRIVFPKGIYLISETNPVVIDHKNTIIDLNGATLQVQSNGLLKYSVVQIVDGADTVRLCNGTIKGDREAHDYKTVKGTHEWGACLSVIGGRNLELDHLRLTDATGDGIGSGSTGARTRPELLEKIKHSIYVKQLESGGFSEAGFKVPNGGTTRTIAPYDMTGCGGAFELGYAGGYMGYPFIKGRVYQAYFYDAATNFLARKVAFQYRKVALPAGAKFMHLEFNQPTVSDEPSHEGALKGEWIARITNFRPSTDVHFHHNVVCNDRRLGMAYCGGQRWVIEENDFENNGGTAPAYGIDLEDGWETMQDVVFRKNRFKGNKAGDLVVCAGSELLFEGNEFEKGVVCHGRPHNYIFRNNRFSGGRVIYGTRTGVARIEGNVYTNCAVIVEFDSKAVADGLYRPAGKTVSTPALSLANETLVNVSRLTGTYICLSRSVLKNVHLVAGKDTRLVQFKDCDFTDCSLTYEADGPSVMTRIENCKGELREEGPGLKRKAGVTAP